MCSGRVGLGKCLFWWLGLVLFLVQSSSVGSQDVVTPREKALAKALIEQTDLCEKQRKLLDEYEKASSEDKKSLTIAVEKLRLSEENLATSEAKLLKLEERLKQLSSESQTWQTDILSLTEKLTNALNEIATSSRKLAALQQENNLLRWSLVGSVGGNILQALTRPR